MASSRSRLARADYETLASFRQALRRFLDFSAQAARAAGLSPQQHQALLAIKGMPPATEITVGVLAERLHIRHHTGVELSRRLERKGWILRSRNADDARRVDLRLTRRGERLLERLSISHRDELRTAGPRLIVALQRVLSHTNTKGRRQRKQSANNSHR